MHCTATHTALMLFSLEVTFTKLQDITVGDVCDICGTRLLLKVIEGDTEW